MHPLWPFFAILLISNAPSFSEGFPLEGARLVEVVRYLETIPAEGWNELPYSAESPFRRHEVEIVRFDVRPWQTVLVENIRSGQVPVDPEGRYAVKTSAYCWWDAAGQPTEIWFLWYVFAGERLVSYDHLEFAVERACAPVARYRRDPAWRDLDFLLALRHGGTFSRSTNRSRRCASVADYERGLAYVAADRMEEAWAVLAAADERARLDRDGKVVAAKPGPHCAEPARRAREALVREIEPVNWMRPPQPASP